MEHRSNKLCAILVLACLLLCSCVKNYELDAVRQIGRPTPARDDHPRVSIGGVDDPSLSVKASFVGLLNQRCSAVALATAETVVAERIAATTLHQKLNKVVQPHDDAQISDKSRKDTSHAVADLKSSDASQDRSEVKEKPSWAELNPRANICQQQITAYAIDQCKFIVQHQNQASVTSGLITSIFSAGSALAVDAAYLAHPHEAKDSSAALIASSVLANSDKIKVLTTTTVSIKDMLPVGSEYAELIGLNDSQDVHDSYTATDAAALKFARTHDAIMSTCTGVAVGL